MTVTIKVSDNGVINDTSIRNFIRLKSKVENLLIAIPSLPKFFSASSYEQAIGKMGKENYPSFSTLKRYDFICFEKFEPVFTRSYPEQIVFNMNDERICSLNEWSKMDSSIQALFPAIITKTVLTPKEWGTRNIYSFDSWAMKDWVSLNNNIQVQWCLDKEAKLDNTIEQLMKQKKTLHEEIQRCTEECY